MLVVIGFRHLHQVAEGDGWVRYRATREADDLPVELKVIRLDPARVADGARLRHEYARIARIESPRLVKVLAIQEHDHGIVVVLEGRRGQDLGELLAARGRLDAAGFLDLACAMAEAVRDLHQHDVFHGALRPGSFVVGDAARGEVRLAEHGVDARVTREHGALHALTALTGALPYLAPEQTGRMSREVDLRADLYSLGVVFYEMLTGRRPFAAEDALELIHAHIAAIPEPPHRVEPSVPPALGELIMKLLRKDAEDRYQSAAGLVADLEECRARLRRDGHLGGFEVGRHDRTAQLLLRQRLYGREDDTRRLTAAFHAALRGERRLVLVSGYSGVGKSSLVQEILRPLARERGYFISGKYDQLHRDKPYSGVVQAFEALLRQILSESEERLERWRAALRHALGKNARVMSDVLPSLRHLIGDPPPVPALGPVESQNRLNLTFHRFVSVFARHAHPLALFLDDLQWIDAASLGLLEALFTGEPLESLFCCGAYRDNEVSPGHPLLRAVGELRKSGIAIDEIALAPLGRPHLAELLRDSLGRADVDALCELVLQKTGGNPFFVKRLLESIHRAGALSFDPQKGWTWDVGAIGALEHASDAVELMLRAIRALPAETQRVVTLASAIGSRFDLGALCTVGECTADEAYGRLEPARREGLIVGDGTSYRFVHDKIQEAAYAMIPPGERAAFHHRIGVLLLSTLGQEGGARLLDTVDHLNRAGDLVRDPGARLDLARKNLAAAEVAEASAAFDTALRYATEGIRRLPAGAWGSEYELTLALMAKQALMDSLAGRHDEALAILSGCFDHARGRLDQTRIRRMKVNVLMLKNDLAGALTEGFAAVGAFGVELSEAPDDGAVEAELAATMQLVAGRPTDALGDLPRLADPDRVALQETLQEIFLPCYFVSPRNYAITVMKVVQSTLEHGITKSSTYAFANFGVFLCARGEVEAGYRFGRAAMQLNDRYPDKKAEPMLYNTWGCSVQHWRESYASYKETLLAGLHVSLETGQHIWAFYNGLNANTNSLLSGRPLGEVLAESRSLQPLLRLDRFDAITWMIRAVAQICHNLSAEVPEPAKLAGEWIQVDGVVEAARSAGNHASIFFARFYEVLLAVFQGAHAEAARLADEADADVPGIASWHGTPCFHFYGGLALALAAEGADPERRARYRKKAQLAGERMERWARVGPENLRHRSLLLSAELAAQAGDAAAGDRYDAAIEAAREGRFLQDEALANELCARHHLRRGKSTIARAYLIEAQDLYEQWGAPRAASSPGRHEEAAREEIDLRSVLKASQALSGEIVLPRLLEKMMRIILESAGARRGFLVLEDDGRLMIEAEGDIEDASVALLRSEPLERRGDLSINAVHYVARTNQSVVLGDASAEPWLAGDPYVLSRRPRSLLVAPIVHQGRTLGAIYLENNAAAFAFTEDRVELLRLLSSQLAVSIENARLFGRLEEKVGARTSELRAANELIMGLHAAREREQERQMEEKLALIERQREIIHELSAPVIQVWDGVLVVPVVGALDDERTDGIMQALLAAVTGSGSRFAIIDLTGVATIDARAADHLLRIARAVDLVGARTLVSGTRPAVARTMVSLQVDMQGVVTHRTLREALRACMRALARA